LRKAISSFKGDAVARIYLCPTEPDGRKQPLTLLVMHTPHMVMLYKHSNMPTKPLNSTLIKLLNNSTSCKFHGVDPLAYLTDVLNRLSSA
jgi:hypothetical protein